MKSDKTQFLNDILNHTRKVGWHGTPVDAKMIQQRLNLNFDYTVWRRSPEACASSVVTGVLDFIRNHFPESAHLYEPTPKIKMSTLPPYPPPQHNLTPMVAISSGLPPRLPPPPQPHHMQQHPPPPMQQQFSSRPPPPNQFSAPPPPGGQRNTISQTFTPSFPPPPPQNIQTNQFSGFPAPPPPQNGQMRMQSFPPPQGVVLHNPPPPPGSNNRYSAFPQSPQSQYPPPQRERSTRNRRFDRR